MTPTRPRTLLLIGVIALAVTWALLTVVYASLPPLTWTLVPALLIGAALEAWTGRDLRARIQGRERARGRCRLLFVARMVALAKASSQAAALLAGVSAGFVIYLSGMTDAPTPRTDLVDASLSFGASAHPAGGGAVPRVLLPRSEGPPRRARRGDRPRPARPPSTINTPAPPARQRPL